MKDVLNPDPYCQFIGPKNLGEALIDDELTTCLLDNGSQLNIGNRQNHGESRRIHYDECQDTQCQGVQ